MLKPIILCLLLSSMLTLSCKVPYPALRSTENVSCMEKFRPVFRTVLYSANVDVMGNYLSGLLFIKTMPDSALRMVFTNQSGIKLFDFEFRDTEFKVIYCIKKLDRKSVLRQLKSDFQLMLFLNDEKTKTVQESGNEQFHVYEAGKEFRYYITDSLCNKLGRIESASKHKRKTTVTLGDYKNGIADSVFISHNRYNFTISLIQKEQHAAE